MTTAAPDAPPDIQAPPIDIATPVAKTYAIRTELKTENVESDSIIDLMLAVVIARGNLFIWGEPGCGKSQVTDALFRRLPGKKFKQQARAQMADEAFFGPISLKGLENDIFRHAITNTLADAAYAYIDEFMDAPDMTLRGLLMVMNERQFTNGTEVIDVPLLSMIGTTNFYRDEPEVVAVLDRFMARTDKPPVQTEEGFLAVLNGHLARLRNGRQEPGPVTTLEWDELMALQTAAREVIVAPAETRTIQQLWATCRAEGITGASARRFNIGTELCMARAILRGANQLSSEDLLGFADVLPSDPDERAKVLEIVADFAGGMAKEARELRKTFTPHAEQVSLVQKQIDADGITGERTTRLIEIADEIKAVSANVELKIAEGQAASADVNDLHALLTEIRGTQSYISQVVLGVKL